MLSFGSEFTDLRNLMYEEVFQFHNHCKVETCTRCTWPRLLIFEHPVSICKEIIQQDINQLMEIIGFTNGNRNRQSIPYLDRLLSTHWKYLFLPTFKISLFLSF